MASKLDIWNLALSHIGSGDTIDDEAEQTLEAEQCRKFYPLALDLLLERHGWDFAIDTVPLSLLSESAPGQWTYRYSVPDDYIRAIQVLGDISLVSAVWITNDEYLRQLQDNAKQYQIEVDSNEKRTIVTNEYQAQLRYVFRNTLTGSFSPGFVMTLSYLLASMIAGPIVKSAKMVASQKAAYKSEFATATSDDANATNFKMAHLPTHMRGR